MKILVKNICLMLIVFGLKYSSIAQPNFVWANQLGGTGSDIGYSIASDPWGNVYTTGYYSGTVDFDPGPGVFTLTSAGATNDIFIYKLTAIGNLVWAKSIGSTGDDLGLSISVDAAGNVYTTGQFQGIVDFDPGVGIVSFTSSGNYDIFVSKLDVSGNFVWTKCVGGTGIDYSMGVALDVSGNVYTTGSFPATVDFDPGAGVFNLVSTGFDDIFVSKLDASGNFAWAITMGGAGGNDRGLSIALDGSGNIHTTGQFQGACDFDPSISVYTIQASGQGGTDAFISKLNATGNFVWATSIGGPNQDIGTSIKVDANSNVYTTGSFMGGADFDPGAGVYTLTCAGFTDVFISKLNVSGNLVWAKSIGGTITDNALSIAIDGSGNVYTTGHFNSTADFDPGPGVFNLTPGGNQDVFVSKLDVLGNFAWAVRMGSSSDDRGHSITVNSSGNILTTGYFNSTVDFDVGPAVFNLTSAGGNDVFIQAINQSPTNVESALLDNNLFNVFPNPNNGTFKIQIDNDSKNSELILINSIGQKVYEQKIIQGQNNIITHNLSSGLYNFIILRDKGQIGKGKLTVE